MKKVVLMLVAGCVVGMLTGCGVPQEEHDAKVAELNKALEDIETLNGEKAGVEEKLAAEGKKARSLRIERDDAIKSVEELKDKEAATAKDLAAEKRKVSNLESDLASAKSATGAAKDHSNELQNALDQLKDEYAKLQNRFDQLKKNMLAIGDSPAASAQESVTADVSGMSGGESSSASDLLDEMGAQ